MIAAKQVIVHNGVMFVVTNAGELWYKDVDHVKYDSHKEWVRVRLPSGDT